MLFRSHDILPINHDAALEIDYLDLGRPVLEEIDGAPGGGGEVGGTDDEEVGSGVEVGGVEEEEGPEVEEAAGVCGDDSLGGDEARGGENGPFEV